MSETVDGSWIPTRRDRATAALAYSLLITAVGLFGGFYVGNVPLAIHIIAVAIAIAVGWRYGVATIDPTSSMAMAAANGAFSGMLILWLPGLLACVVLMFVAPPEDMLLALVTGLWYLLLASITVGLALGAGGALVGILLHRSGGRL